MQLEMEAGVGIGQSGNFAGDICERRCPSARELVAKQLTDSSGGVERYPLAT